MWNSQENSLPSIAGLIVVLLILALAFLIRCSSPTTPENDPAFDSLALVVNLKLKTNADSGLKASEILYKLTTEKQDATQIYEARRLRGQAFLVAGMNDSAYRATKGSVANLLPLKFNYANYLSKFGRCCFCYQHS